MRTAIKVRQHPPRVASALVVALAALFSVLSVGAYPAAATAAPSSIMVISDAETALSCQNPCEWESGPYDQKILAQKAAEQKAVALHNLGYTILSATTKQTATSIWHGLVGYVS